MKEIEVTHEQILAFESTIADKGVCRSTIPTELPHQLVFDQPLDRVREEGTIEFNYRCQGCGLRYSRFYTPIQIVRGLEPHGEFSMPGPFVPPPIQYEEGDEPYIAPPSAE